MVHDYGRIHSSYITSLETTRDSKWLITGSRNWRVKRISVESREVHKGFGQVSYEWMNRMKITADDEKLLVGDSAGQLK